MDHLPTVFHEFEVPYLEYDQYENVAFSEYPRHKGWPIFENGDVNGKDDSQFAAFLQTWLFFRLLTEFLGENVK